MLQNRRQMQSLQGSLMHIDNKNFQDPDWQGAVSAIRQSKSVLLIAHVTPDADALGSAIALGIALESLEKEVQVSVGEPGFKIPDSLNFLPRLDLITAPELVHLADLVIVCDTASIERLGILADALTHAQSSIAIDHHSSFTGFGTIHLVLPSAPATAVITLELIDRLEVKLSKDIASAIYSGLATDTGSFKFQSTTPETLRIGARLFEAGIDHSELARKLFDDEPFIALQMLGDSLGRAKLDESAIGGRGFAFTSISIDDRRGLPELAMERVIETIRRTSEAEVCAVFKQSDSGEWKVSLRSKTSVDVSQVAISLGGGGHFYAAGYTGSKNYDETLNSLKSQLELLGK